MGADDHSGIDIGAGRYKKRPALLQVPQRIGNRGTLGVRYQDAGAAPLDRALVGCITVEQTAHDAAAARIGQKLAVIADQAAGRRQKRETQFAAA